MRLAHPRGEALWIEDPGEYASDQIARSGDYFERDILGALEDLVAPGVMIDAGAHLGNHTMYAIRHLGATAVHAFEPNPRSLEILRKNAAGSPRVVIHPLALGDRKERWGFSWDGIETGHCRRGREGRHRIRAGVIPLDSLDLEGVTLLKIDVEGDEPAVLRGAARTLERSRPILVLEDWAQAYRFLLPGWYRLLADFGISHQTYVYGP